MLTIIGALQFELMVVSGFWCPIWMRIRLRHPTRPLILHFDSEFPLGEEGRCSCSFRYRTLCSTHTRVRHKFKKLSQVWYTCTTHTQHVCVHVPCTHRILYLYLLVYRLYLCPPRRVHLVHVYLAQHYVCSFMYDNEKNTYRYRRTYHTLLLLWNCVALTSHTPTHPPPPLINPTCCEFFFLFP